MMSCSLITYKTLSMHQFTSPIHERKQSLQIECEICEICSHANHYISFNLPLRNWWPRESTVVSTEFIASFIDVMNYLMRHFNHIHVWWLGSCSSSRLLTGCCRCTCALSLCSCLSLIPYIDSYILLLARTA